MSQELSTNSLDSLSQPKSDLSDLGHFRVPNSGKPEFGRERVGVRGAWKKRPLLNPSPGRHRFAVLSSGSRPLPPQVGLARLAHYDAEPGKPGFGGERWTEHVAPLSHSNALSLLFCKTEIFEAETVCDAVRLARRARYTITDWIKRFLQLYSLDFAERTHFFSLQFNSRKTRHRHPCMARHATCIATSRRCRGRFQVHATGHRSPPGRHRG